MSFYSSLSRFSNFLLTVSLITTSSGWAMEREGEPFQPGDEGNASHVVARALEDIAPASDFSAAAARAAAFDNDANRRREGASPEGLSPAALQELDRDFPVESMRQWEASFR